MPLPLILIPALCCDEALYEPVSAGLADLCAPRVLNVAAPALEECAARVLARVEGPFAIAGTSFGGHVAREVALAAPARVRGLWIMGAGPGGVADPAAGRERGELLRSGRADVVYRRFAEIVVHEAGPLAKQALEAFIAMTGRADPRCVAIQNDALVTRPDRWNDLHRIACPSLLIWGQYDRFSPAADGRRMAGLIPNARFAELADRGHLPTLEAPEAVVFEARRWLGEVNAKS